MKVLFPTAFVLLIASFAANANIVAKASTNVDQPEPNKPFTLSFTFAEGQNQIACGMLIDWGDGKSEKLRFGDGQQVSSPYAVEHAYASSGQYKLRVTGETIFRGLRSVPPCQVGIEGIIRVVDPAEAARAAAEERERRERAESEAKARKEREEAAKAEEATRLAAERSAHFKTPQGKKELENTQRLVSQLLNKPLSKDCSSPTETVWVFQGSKATMTKQRFFSTYRPVEDIDVVQFDYLGKELVSTVLEVDPWNKPLPNSQRRSVEYKIDPAGLQVFNDGEAVKNGVNARGDGSALWKICPPSSAAAKTVANELSGAAVKIREQRAKDEAVAKEKKRLSDFLAKDFQIMFLCNTEPNPSAHSGLATNILLGAKGGPAMYGQILMEYRSMGCSAWRGDKSFKDIDLFEEKGKIVTSDQTNIYVSIPINRFSSIGLIGKK